MGLSGKKIFLAGFIVVLLAGIPITLFLLQQQQETRSRAEKSTTISFSPDSSATNPIQKQVGDSIPLDVMVNPGTNQVTFVKLEIQYDPTKLATTGANTVQVNTNAFPGQGEGPLYSDGKVIFTLNVGPDPTKVIQQTTRAATITLKAIANTPAGTPTLVTYGANTQVLSSGSNDQASENVLSTATPATIVIGGSGGGGSPTPVGSGTPIPIPTGSPTPTTPLPSTVPSATLTPTMSPTPTLSPTVTPTSAPGATGAANQPPVCSSLAVDRATTGAAPFSITFSANGTDPDGTVSKVTFNFGDGQVSDVTQAGGIGTNTVNVQIAHTYNNPGTYQASAILTDSNNAVSNSNNCQQSITVTSASGSAQPTLIAQGGTPSPTMKATGSSDVALGIGATALLLIIGGGLLFFIL